MGLAPITDGKLLNVALLIAATLTNVSGSEVVNLKKQRDCYSCSAVNCPLQNTPVFNYLHDDPVLEEICSRYWR